MIVKALFEAASTVQAGETPVQLSVMVPGVSDVAELAAIKDLVAEVANIVGDVSYRFGTMIELPRACLLADRLAALSDFFWCGTNDLTQATTGFSNYDAIYNFIPVYLDEGILEKNPFQILDVEGVGALLEIATTRGRSVKSDLHIGICGDQGSDPTGIAFCQSIGINAVSTDPRRVPAARLAAAQAALARVSPTELPDA